MNLLHRTLLISLAMLAFAGNSLLSRLALSTGASDAVSFTVVRLASAALMLALILRWRGGKSQAVEKAPALRSWLPGITLFVYAAGFSWAYVLMPAATGALILFGSVQLTMVTAALLQGEKLRAWQWLGFCLGLAGMAQLAVPTLATPSAMSFASMVLAGIAWGTYSLLGRGSNRPLENTAANFWRALPLGLIWALFQYHSLSMNQAGLIYATLSGALTSGIGYAIWYHVLPTLRASQATGVQLSVPLIAVFMGWLFLGESITWPLMMACITILVSMALMLRGTPRPAPHQN
jgi:drug/metabolite transporter (DMT)-like permease